MKLLCEVPVNSYLLCAVVSKHTRRLGRLMPEERIAELITIALRNCADHEFEIQVDANTPDVIREEAARMFPPARIVKAGLVQVRSNRTGGKQKMQLRLSAGSKQQTVRKYTESPIFANLQRVLTFLWAMVSILLILVAIYMTVRGTSR